MSARRQRAMLQETLWGSEIGGALWPFQPLGWNYLRPLHFHDQTEVLFVRRGTLRLTLGGQEYFLHPGHLAWIVPSVEHRVDELSQDADFWSLQIEPTLIRSARGSLWAEPWDHKVDNAFGDIALALPDPPIFEIARHHADAIEETAHVAWSLYLSTAAGRAPPNPNFEWIPRWESASASAARESLIACYRAMSAAASSELASTRNKTFIHHAFDAMLVDPTLSRRELSSRLGISDGHLSRRFPEIFGVSLVTQRARLRLVQFLNLAKSEPQPNLLRHSLEAGFGSYAQLHRVFRRHSAFAPSDYVLGPGRLMAGAVVR